MPRLTFDERRFIADAMADGLGYAEIARRLNRPTSTVSREVARNIGSDGYQPERAESVTRQRARRPKTAGPTTKARTTKDRRDFEARLVAVLGEKGVPRMASRVMASLCIADCESLTAAELVRRLEVSPASVSAAIAYLTDLQLIRREHDGRRDRYMVDSDAMVRTSMASALTMDRWARVSHEGAILFGDSVAGVRMAKMGMFLEKFTEDMVASIDRWRHLLYP
jgi:DNA-binding transcriptional ArsR family regulator